LTNAKISFEAIGYEGTTRQSNMITYMIIAKTYQDQMQSE